MNDYEIFIMFCRIFGLIVGWYIGIQLADKITKRWFK